MKAIKINKRYVTIKFTLQEAMELDSVVGQANSNGDHREYLIDSNATPEQIKALDNVMEKVSTACGMAVIMKEQLTQK